MNRHNGAGDGGVATESVITAATEEVSSLDGYAMAPEGALAERPELLLGAAFLGGLLLAGLVRRLGR
jgi:hypothetical protein